MLKNQRIKKMKKNPNKLRSNSRQDKLFDIVPESSDDCSSSCEYSSWKPSSSDSSSSEGEEVIFKEKSCDNICVSKTNINSAVDEVLKGNLLQGIIIVIELPLVS